MATRSGKKSCRCNTSFVPTTPLTNKHTLTITGKTFSGALLKVELKPLYTCCRPHQPQSSMSYAARASNRRGGPAAAAAGDSKAAAPTLPSLSRPQLHSRKHSANSAGDVFAMPNIGQRKVSASTDKDRQQATILEQSITEEPAGKQKTSTKARAAEESTSGPSSSPAADPSSSLSPAADARSKSVYSHGRPSAKRYKTLYSKPTLLKLWSQKLTVDAVFDELYSAFEVCDRLFLHFSSQAPNEHTSARRAFGK